MKSSPDKKDGEVGQEIFYGQNMRRVMQAEEIIGQERFPRLKGIEQIGQKVFQTGKN